MTAIDLNVGSALRMANRDVMEVRAAGRTIWSPPWVPKGDNGSLFTAGAKYTTRQFWHQGQKADNAAFKASMGLVFSRTSSKGYLNSSGAYAVASANVEAFDTTAGGVARGLSMEVARTNIAIQSNTLSAADWSKDAVTVAASGDRWQIRETTTASVIHRVLKGAEVVVAGTPVTRSHFVRKAGRRYGFDRFMLDGVARNVGYDFDTGLITFASAGFGTPRFTAVPGSPGEFLLEVTATPTTTTFQLTGAGPAAAAVTSDAAPVIIGAGDPAQGLDFRDDQMEAGLFRSSTMRTGAGSFVRTQDFLANVSAGGLPFPGFDPTQLTFLWQGETAHVTGSPTEVLFSFDDNTSNNRIECAINGSGQCSLVVVTGGVVQAAFTTGVIARNTVFRVGFGCGPDPANPGGPSIAKFYLNGAQVSVTDTNVAIPTVTRLRLGSGGAGGSPMQGWIAEWWHQAATAWGRMAALSVVGAV